LQGWRSCVRVPGFEPDAFVDDSNDEWMRYFSRLESKTNRKRPGIRSFKIRWISFNTQKILCFKFQGRSPSVIKRKNKLDPARLQSGMLCELYSRYLT